MKLSEIRAYVVTSDYETTVGREDAISHPGLVKCNKCSSPGYQVYHNRLGPRRHVDDSLLKDLKELK